MSDFPDLAVANLVDAGVPSLTLNTNLFVGALRPSNAYIPHQAVFCLVTGGQEPLTHSQNNEGPDVLRSFVQVMIRSNVNEFIAGQTLARSVWSSLQRAVYTDYMSITCVESEPVYVGMDDTEHHHWMVNVKTWREG